jgi:hypothetical protein
MSTAEPAPSAPVTDSRSSFRTKPLIGLMVALLAGVTAWSVLQVTSPVFRIADELTELPMPLPVDKSLELDAAMYLVSRQNAAYSLGIIGALLGLLLAVSESVARGSVATALPKGLFAGALAGLAGMAAGWMGAPTRDLLAASVAWSPLARTIVLQLSVLGLVAVGVGLGIGLPYARPRFLWHCLLGAVLAATLTAIIYPAVVGYCLPIVDTELVVPGNRGGQLPWALLFTGLTGLVLSGLGQHRPTG